MKKLILSLAMLCGSIMGMQAQLLYKLSIQNNDSIANSDSTASIVRKAVKPSYVMASCRLINPMGTISQDDSVRYAIQHTDQMYFEVNKSAYANTLGEAKLLTDDKTLLSLLTPAQQAKLNAFLKKYMEVDFRSTYVQNKYGHLTPVALLDDLEQLLFVANHMGVYDPTHTFDQYFEAQAKANNESIGGLSDVDSYINATYRSDLKKQVNRLMSFLENEGVELSKMNKAVDAFTAKDLDVVGRTVDTQVDKTTLATWATKISEIMAEKPTLFVVDAANLSGTEGLLQQLRDAGILVEGIK